MSPSTPSSETPKAQPVAGIILTALAALLFAGVATFAGPCAEHDGTAPSSCHWAARAVIAAASVAAVLGLIRIFETDEGERRGLSLGCALSGFLCAAVPGLVIDLCASPTMRCNTIMRPYVLVFGLAIGFTGAADLTRRLLAIKKRP